MQRNSRSILRRNSLFDSKVRFLRNSLGTLFLGVFGDFTINFFSTLLENLFGIQSDTFWPILILCILISIFFGILKFFPNVQSWVLRRLPWRGREIIEPNVQTLKTPCKGLIVFASPSREDKRTSAEEAIVRHLQLSSQLEHCWIIGTESSIETVRKIRNQYEDQVSIHSDIPIRSQSGDRTLVSFLKDEDINDPEYLQDVINEIYCYASSFGFQDSDIIADFTGGTKAMTAGMILACIAPGRRMEYFSQLDQDRENGEDLKEISLDYEIR